MLKKEYKELEFDFELTCSSQAGALNKNAKEKIDNNKASALASRIIQAESNRKLHQVMKHIRKLEREYSMVLAIKENSRLPVHIYERKTRRTSCASKK